MMAGFNPYGGRENDINQRLDLAKALRQKSLTDDQGQMVSGHYIAPSWSQGLARLLQGGLGAKEMMGASSDQRSLDAERQQALTQALGGYASGGDPRALLSNPDTMEAGMKAIGTRSAADYAAALKGPTSREVMMDNQRVTLQWDPKTQQSTEIGRGPAFAPHSGPQALETYRAVHPEDASMQGFDKWQRENKAAGAQGGGEYMSFFPTTSGLIGAYNKGPHIGESRLLNSPDGSSYVKPADDPSRQRDIADAKAGGKVTGTTQAQAAIDLPKAEDQAKYTLGVIGKALSHPGLSAVVGVPGITNYFPGTDAAGFKAVLKQLQGGQFLQAYDTLKGGGQITEVEGAKAQNAQARMDTAQSEDEFKAALTEYKGIITSALIRARNKAKMGDSQITPPPYTGTDRRTPGVVTGDASIHDQADAILRGN